MRSTYSRRKKCQPGSTWRMWRSGSSLRPQLSGSEGPAAARTNGPISPMIIGPTFSAPGRGQLRASRAGTQRGSAAATRTEASTRGKAELVEALGGCSGRGSFCSLRRRGCPVWSPTGSVLGGADDRAVGELVIAADRAVAGARHCAG